MNAARLGMIILLWGWLLPAQAAVSLAGTRLVFDGRFAEASIEARNRSDQEVLLQIWLKDGRGDDDAIDQALPFVVTPHLLRLPAHGREQLRLLYQGQGMPEGRESLLHLYVLEIPRRAEGARQLNIALRQRINVFYRPQDLQGDPAQVAELLRWERTGAQSLRLRNPTPFYAALLDIRLGDVQLSDYLMLAPGAAHDWALPAVPDASALAFQALTDYGGQRGYCTNLRTLQTFEYNKEQC